MAGIWPHLVPDVIQHFAAVNVTKCYCAYYATKLNDVLARVVNQSILHTLGQNSVSGIVDYPEEADVMYPELQCNFINNTYTYTRRSLTRPMQGSYLFIATPVLDDTSESKNKASADVENCAAFISLLHGEFVATERHFAALYDLSADSVTVASPTVQIRQSPNKEFRNQALASLIDREVDCNFSTNTRCLALIRRAHHETDSTIKFLFMWLALEAAIGDGKQRRRFAIDTMKSTYLDSVISALREKRSALVHDGDLVGLTQIEYLQLKCVVIMGLTNNQNLRDKILNFLEHKLVHDSNSAPFQT